MAKQKIDAYVVYSEPNIPLWSVDWFLHETMFPAQHLDVI